VEGYGVGSYDQSKAPVMAFYKDSSETSASLKNGEFLVSWLTISKQNCSTDRIANSFRPA
jgi:hypothetical protein